MMLFRIVEDKHERNNENIHPENTNCRALERCHNTLLLCNTSGELVFTSFLASKGIPYFLTFRTCIIISSKSQC
jgi:hypothetical protein